MNDLPGAPLGRRRLFGLDFIDAGSVEPIAREVVTREPGPIEDDCLPVVVTPNVDHLVRLDRGARTESMRLARGARWILPDGQPVVWASRLLGHPLRARLAGSDLVTDVFPALVAAGRTVVVVATSAEVEARLRSEGDRVHPVLAPMLDLHDPAAIDAFVQRCAALVDEVRPTHVFVTLGFPKQDVVISALLDRAPAEAVPVMLAVGASFDMHYGLVRRAPRWVQRCGLEWFFRFVQEPRRLFRRYFVDDPAFIRLVWREWRHRG